MEVAAVLVTAGVHPALDQLILIAFRVKMMSI